MVMSLVVVGRLACGHSEFFSRSTSGPPDNVESFVMRCGILPAVQKIDRGSCIVQGICKRQLTYLRETFPHSFKEPYTPIDFQEYQTIAVRLEAPPVTVLTILAEKYGYRTVTCTSSSYSSGGAEFYFWTLNKD